MTHKCPSEPCEDCWDEARAAGMLVVLFGIAATIMWLVG
jgi:hypothetical protein